MQITSILASLLLASAAAAAPVGAPVNGTNATHSTSPGDAVVVDDALVNRECQRHHNNYVRSLKPGKYAMSDFFKCFRDDKQIFELLDVFVKQNPHKLSKFQISTTVLGKKIWAYKLTKHCDQPKPKSLYIQSQLHAREWVAVSSHVYSIARFLDDVAANKPGPWDLYNIYHVPLVNIDGYQMTWNGTNRLQRKNANEVDLNRQWPTPYPNPDILQPDDDEWPGAGPFSEPESKGIRDFLYKNKKVLDGYIDVHTYGGAVLLPYGDTYEPHKDDCKYQVLVNNTCKVMNNTAPLYSWDLYLSYGAFQDWIAREFDRPSLTIEMAGDDFIVNASTIVDRGIELYNGLKAFAPEVVRFLKTTNPPTPKPTLTTLRPTGNSTA